MAVIIYVHRFDCHHTLKGSGILGGSSVNEISCYCPGGCDLNILYISAYTGCHILFYGCFWSSTTHITEDARPNIVDALLTLCWPSVDALLTLCWRSVDALLMLCWRSVDALLTLCWHSVDTLLMLCWRSVDALLTLCWRSFSGCGWAHEYACFAHQGGKYTKNEPCHTNVNRVRLTVAYLNATLNVKPEMQNRRLETTGLVKPSETRGLTSTDPGVARQESAGRLFGRVWIRTDQFLLSKPGPLAGYVEPLLTLPARLTHIADSVRDTHRWTEKVGGSESSRQRTFVGRWLWMGGNRERHESGGWNTWSLRSRAHRVGQQTRSPVRHHTGNGSTFHKQAWPQDAPPAETQS